MLFSVGSHEGRLVKWLGCLTPGGKVLFEGYRRQTRPLLSGMYMKKSLQVAFNKRDAIKTVTNDGD